MAESFLDFILVVAGSCSPYLVEVPGFIRWPCVRARLLAVKLITG